MQPGYNFGASPSSLKLLFEGMPNNLSSNPSSANDYREFPDRRSKVRRAESNSPLGPRPGSPPDSCGVLGVGFRV